MANSIFWRSNLNFKLTVAGILLSLSIIFLIFSHNYFNWPFFQNLGLKVDLSTLFFIPIFLISGFGIGIICLLIRFLIGPRLIFNTFGGIDIVYFGHFILFLASSIYIFSFLSFRFLLKKIFINSKKTKTFIILALIFAVLVTTFLMTYLNGVLITPVYFKLYKITESISLLKMIEHWSEIREKFGGLKLSYWTFILSAFAPFNLANYSLESFLALPICIIADYFLSKRVKN
ncbi:MPN527 family putative ECF transporter permease subunit [Mesomycoplasma hyopneumoniae]|uniref:MPN527 family putative ECF transporter permease subunit n=1 Tax=Mesomycoplasma hyopneumoniae TaxID=2099 RepID=UPI003DA32249